MHFDAGQLTVIPQSLGGSALSRAAQSGDADRWYEAAPASPDAWRGRCRRIGDDFRGRDWFAALEKGFGGKPNIPDRLARVAREGGVVVTTGQQPGLFGGPAYTWLKALHALELADALEQQTGIPAAPVFWAATDDTDFAEASYTVLALPGGAERVASTLVPDEGRPLSHAPLGDVSTAFELLTRAAGSAADARPLETARRAYNADATIGGAYLELLRSLLVPLGIGVLDASSDAVSSASREILERALERAGDVDRSAAERVREIETAGFSPQVPLVDGLSLVFEYEQGRYRKQRVPLAAAADVRRRRSILGPNVLLRPVVERFILPTAAYIGGPGEIAYFAQVSAVADALRAPRPLALPRWSGTIVEPRIAATMERLGLTLEDLADPHAPETRLARDAMPAEVRSGLDALRGDVQSARDVLAQHTVGLTPSAVIDGAVRDIQHRIERLERRLVAAQKRQSVELARDLGTVRGALMPFGARQERAVNLLPLWSRHGDALVMALRSAIRETCMAQVAGNATVQAATLG